MLKWTQLYIGGKHLFYAIVTVLTGRKERNTAWRKLLLTHLAFNMQESGHVPRFWYTLRPIWTKCSTARKYGQTCSYVFKNLKIRCSMWRIIISRAKSSWRRDFQYFAVSCSSRTKFQAKKKSSLSRREDSDESCMKEDSKPTSISCATSFSYPSHVKQLTSKLVQQVFVSRPYDAFFRHKAAIRGDIEYALCRNTVEATHDVSRLLLNSETG